MAFGVYIPGICRLVFIRTPDEVRAVNDATVTARSLSGRGGLVNRAIADARTDGSKIVPLCSYVAAQFRRHPEWADLRA